jgi:hypothetical protein
MNAEQLHRDLGRVEGEVKAIRRELDAMSLKLDNALTYITTQKAVRRNTIAIACTGGTLLGTLASLAVAWFK